MAALPARLAGLDSPLDVVVGLLRFAVLAGGFGHLLQLLAYVAGNTAAVLTGSDSALAIASSTQVYFGAFVLAPTVAGAVLARGHDPTREVWHTVLGFFVVAFPLEIGRELAGVPGTPAVDLAIALFAVACGVAVAVPGRLGRLAAAVMS